MRILLKLARFLKPYRFYLAAALLGAVASFVQDYLMPRIGHWVMHDVRRHLYWHIQGLSLSYHNEQRLGDLMSTLTGDINVARELIESALLGLLVNSVALSSMILIIVAMDWRFALIALSVAPVLFVLVYRFTRRVKQAS